MPIKKTVQTQVARTPSTNLLTSYSSQQYLDIQDTATVSTTLSGCISRIEPGRKPKRLLYMQQHLSRNLPDLKPPQPTPTVRKQQEKQPKVDAATTNPYDLPNLLQIMTRDSSMESLSQMKPIKYQGIKVKVKMREFISLVTQGLISRGENHHVGI